MDVSVIDTIRFCIRLVRQTSPSDYKVSDFGSDLSISGPYHRDKDPTGLSDF